MGEQVEVLFIGDSMQETVLLYVPALRSFGGSGGVCPQEATVWDTPRLGQWVRMQTRFAL